MCLSTARDLGPILDLEKVIQEYAWRELKRDSRWYECSLLRRACYEIEVPWNFYEFEHQTVRFVPRAARGTDAFRERKHVELFSTDYRNNTGKEQVYNLKTQRQTTAVTSVNLQRGFTVDGKTNIKLRIPDRFGHCGVTASADGHLRINNSGETIQETFTWHVESDITVDPYHVTKVSLMVTEDEFAGDFEVRSLMRMTTGEAPIILKRKRDGHISAVLLVSDLGEIFNDVNYPMVRILKADDGDKRSAAIEITSTGVLESLRWRDQRIAIESLPITSLDTDPGDQTTDDGSSYSQSVYSQVVKRSDQEPSQRKPSLKELKARAEGRSETKDMRFKIIPKIVTESPDEVFVKNLDTSPGDLKIDTVVQPKATSPNVTTETALNQSTKSEPAEKKKPEVFEDTVCDVKSLKKEDSSPPTYITVTKQMTSPTSSTTPPTHQFISQQSPPTTPPISSVIVQQTPHPPLRRPDAAVPPYKLSFDKPLKAIKEHSLEDKQKSEDDASDKVDTPDSSDSAKFSKVTSV